MKKSFLFVVLLFAIILFPNKSFADNEIMPSAINGYDIKVTNISADSFNTNNVTNFVITGENLPILANGTPATYYGSNYASLRLSTGSVTWSCTTGCTMGVKLQSSTSTELKFSIQGTQQTIGSLNYTGDLILYIADAGSNTRPDNNKSVIGTYNLTSKVFTEGDKVVPETPKVSNSTHTNGETLVSWEPVSNEDVEYYNLYVNGVLFKRVTAPLSTIVLSEMNVNDVIQLTAVDFSGNESVLSEIVSPEYPEQPIEDRAILVVTMTTGLEKEYDLPMSDVNAFLNWYDARDVGTGPAKFAINKYSNNKGPFSKRTDYVIFDKILTFEVSEYTTN